MNKEYQSQFWPNVRRCPDCPFKLVPKIAIVPIVDSYGLNYSEIEEMEDNILVCPSGCGYYENMGDYPLDPSILNVIEPEPEPEPKTIQLPLPLEFYAEQPQTPVLQPNNRQRVKILVAPAFPSSYTHVYNQYLLAEISAKNRKRKG